MTVMLLTEHNLEFLSLKGGCTGSSESIHLFMPKCHIIGNYMSRLICECFHMGAHILGYLTCFNCIEESAGHFIVCMGCKNR